MSSRTGENIPAISHTSRQSRSRRSHGKVLAPLADSSEDEPSPHSSIYEAPLASDSEVEGITPPSGKRGTGFAPVRSSDVGIVNTTEDEDAGRLPSTAETNTAAGAGSGVNWSPVSQRIGRPSLGLETIIERKSNNTLREELAFPRLDRRPSSEFTGEDDDGGDDAQLLPRGRRKKTRTESSRSGSFDYYNDEVYEYASPSQPLYQSIPVSNNAVDARLSPATPPLGGTPPISASFFNRNYSPSSPIRTPPQGPTFRPPTSGYRSYGSLANHPFHSAPIARSDLGEGSSQMGGTIGFSATGTSTPDSLRSRGRSRTGSVTDGSGVMEKWKFWQICGIFCLGRREED